VNKSLKGVPEFPFWQGSRLIGCGPGYLLFYQRHVYTLSCGEELSLLARLLGNSSAFDKKTGLNQLARSLLFFDARNDTESKQLVERSESALTHAFTDILNESSEASQVRLIDKFVAALRAVAKLRRLCSVAAKEQYDHREKVLALLDCDDEPIAFLDYFGWSRKQLLSGLEHLLTDERRYKGTALEEVLEPKRRIKAEDGLVFYTCQTRHDVATTEVKQTRQGITAVAERLQKVPTKGEVRLELAALIEDPVQRERMTSSKVSHRCRQAGFGWLPSSQSWGFSLKR
jgi:hypothetical protein